MSTVNYDLKNKGVRLLDAQEAWIKGKNGKLKLNPNYYFVGKVDSRMSNMIITASDRTKPKYKGDVSYLNGVAKQQMINHFYDDKGKRNKKSVAYFAIKKK